MRILVAVASRHGGTRDIGDRIGERLSDAGFDVQLVDMEQVTNLDGIDAAVLGSAVYMGQWEQAARRFVEHHRAELTARPTWVFSSGPIGAMGAEAGGAEGHEHAMQAVEPINAQVFGGVLDHRTLSMRERFICKLLHVPEGDYRDWAAIDKWADGIAQALTGVPAGVAGCERS